MITNAVDATAVQGIPQVVTCAQSLRNTRPAGLYWLTPRGPLIKQENILPNTVGCTCCHRHCSMLAWRDGRPRLVGVGWWLEVSMGVGIRGRCYCAIKQCHRSPSPATWFALSGPARLDIGVHCPVFVGIGSLSGTTPAGAQVQGKAGVCHSIGSWLWLVHCRRLHGNAVAGTGWVLTRVPWSPLSSGDCCCDDCYNCYNCTSVGAS